MVRHSSIHIGSVYSTTGIFLSPLQALCHMFGGRRGLKYAAQLKSNEGDKFSSETHFWSRMTAPGPPMAGRLRNASPTVSSTARSHARTSRSRTPRASEMSSTRPTCRGPDRPELSELAELLVTVLPVSQSSSSSSSEPEVSSLSVPLME
eukprot:EG_transcript_37396